MKLVEFHNEYINIPTEWNELSSQQLLDIVHLFDSRELKEDDARIQLIRILTGMTMIKMWYNGFAAIEDKLYLVDFILASNALTKNILADIDGFYGPADDFNNLVISEFIFSEMHYLQYKEAPETNESSLDKMIAILYRPCKPSYDVSINPDGDVREVFNENLTEYYAKQIRSWPRYTKRAILQWYEGCKASLVEANPDIFSGAEGDPSKYGLWSVMRGVAEKGIHGNIHEVEKMYLKVFMMELNEIMEEAKRLKNEMELQKQRV